MLVPSAQQYQMVLLCHFEKSIAGSQADFHFPSTASMAKTIMNTFFESLLVN